MSASVHQKKWAVVARMNIALTRLSHASYFPPTLGLAESLVLRVMLQYAFLWDTEGRPATISRLARKLGLSRPTTKRKLNVLIGYGYIRREGRHYRCADRMERLQQTPAFYDRYTAVITQTCKELAKLGRLPAVPD